MSARESGGAGELRNVGVEPMVNAAGRVGIHCVANAVCRVADAEGHVDVGVVSNGNVAVPPGGTMIARLIWEVSVTVAVRYCLEYTYRKPRSRLG